MSESCERCRKKGKKNELRFRITWSMGFRSIKRANMLASIVSFTTQSHHDISLSLSLNHFPRARPHPKNAQNTHQNRNPHIAIQRGENTTNGPQRTFGVFTSLVKHRATMHAYTNFMPERKRERNKDKKTASDKNKNRQ